MPLSLRRAASLNSARVHGAADHLVAADPSGTLAEFRVHAGGAVLAINVQAAKVRALDEARAVLDGRAIQQRLAGGDRRAGLAEFRRIQGKWFTGRVRFEALWQHGRRLVYGALNTGGLGPKEAFGRFCLVVEDPEAHRPEALAVFPSNTAARYCTVRGVVDRAAAAADVTAWDDRADLAVIERAAEALDVHRIDWARVICDDERFLEVVVAPGPPIDAIDAVRIPQPLLDVLEEAEARRLDEELLAAQDERSPDEDVLPGADRAELVAFETIQRWRRSHGLRVEGVP